MDNKTLAFSYTIVAVSIFIASLMIAVYRKDKSLKTFSYSFGASFGASAVGSILLSGQGIISPWFSLVLGNMLLIIGHMLIVGGIRAFYKEKVVLPKHFLLYLMVYFLAFVYATFINYSFVIRIVVYTAFLAIIMTELYVYIRPRLLTLSSIIRNAFKVIILGYVGINVVRAISIFIAARDTSTLMNNDIFSGLNFIANIIILVFWFNVFQMLDSMKVINQMNEKNISLNSMAQTDKLTGIYNRHYLEQNIEEYIGLSDRLGEPISLILVDLDHFKDVNDQHGHTVGD